MKIILPDYECPSWNFLNARCHWSKRSELAREAHEFVRAMVVINHLKPVTKPVHITITAHQIRPTDPDNVCDKFIIDGLRLAGILKDDTNKYVLSVTTTTLKDHNNFIVIDLE